MANIRLIKGRIKTAKNIAQITKAMELVAASKMKKAQQKAIAGKIYAEKIYHMVMLLAAKVNYAKHPLLAKVKVPTGKRLVILISSNKGLCGSLNTNLFRSVFQQYEHIDATFVTLGKKGAEFIARMAKPIQADFSDSNTFTKFVPAVTELVTSQYIAGNFDSIDLVYSDFITVLTQKPKKKTILPLTIEATSEESKSVSGEFLIEPNPERVFEALLPHYLENQIRDAVLEAEASEHSARMVAMRNATDNANSLSEELTLVYNKARQEKITYEITDLVTARLASEA